MTRPRFVFSPRYSADIGGHAFPTRKFGLTAERLKGRGDFVEPSLPPREDLLLAHEEAWVDKVVGLRMTLDDELRMELPFTREVSEAHQLGLAGTILACRDALERGTGLHVGGGSHHAFPGHGEGFCVLNDLAAGVLAMRREGRAARAAVLDLDVHQGNGTAAVFSRDPAVFTFSVHQEDLYPQPKVPGSLDVGLPAGTGDEDYLAALRGALPRVLAHKPDLVVYQAGVDAGARDLLGGLALTPAGLEARDRLVLEACRGAGVPVAVTLGGGYAADVGETVALHLRTLEVFAGLF